jgi:hypothetical protein
VVETSAVIVRLDVQAETLHRIEDHLARLNGRVAGTERWQAATDPVLDSLNERVDINTELTTGHQTYIDQQKGGAAMRLQIIALVVSLLSIVSLTIKMMFGRG